VAQEHFLEKALGLAGVLVKSTHRITFAIMHNLHARALQDMLRHTCVFVVQDAALFLLLTSP